MGKVTMGSSKIPRSIVFPVKEIQPTTIEVIKEIPVEVIRTVEVIKEVPVEVIKIETKTIEIPVEKVVEKERIVFVEKPVEVIKEVKIIDIEKLMLANAEIRNLSSTLSVYKWLLLGAVCVIITMGIL